LLWSASGPACGGSAASSAAPLLDRSGLPPSSGSKSNPNEQAESLILLSLPLNPEDGGSVFVQNVGELLLHYTASHPRI
jgi:hypothetical protein